MSRTAPGCHRPHPPPDRPSGLPGGHRDGASGRGQGSNAITSALIGTLAPALSLQRLSAVRLIHLGEHSQRGYYQKMGEWGKGPPQWRAGEGVEMLGHEGSRDVC